MAREQIDTHKHSLAQTLRRLRTERDLSQAELGRATGISRSFLSLVEQGRSDISIGRLLRLAEFYDVELTDLLDGDEADPHRVRVLRVEPEYAIHSRGEGADLFDLATGARRELMPVLGVVQAGSEVEFDNVPEREAMLFVLDGAFEFQVGDHEPVRLRRGEGALYRSGGTYSIRNVSNRTGRLLGISIRHRPAS